MTDGTHDTGGARTGLPPWAKKTVWVLLGLLALVVLYFVLAAFVPRWWAQRIAGLADGGMARGTLWGLVFGFLCTFVPLALLSWVWRVRGWRYHRGLQIALAIVALVVAVPNLMTLSIVLGGGNAAHAGERILDVDGPGFRGASLVGAVLGALVFVIVTVVSMRHRKRSADLRRARGELELERAEKETAAEWEERERKRKSDAVDGNAAD
ncbi:hypothetical protein [Rhodococcus phenolicus]|uniref:hypothetical protein n=1 Tax=Rhodococcus phenolicus TaxID=263849 RepID=UPI00082FAD90|nr:hypothetical protein [Rhodococcus phenolicus]